MNYVIFAVLLVVSNLLTFRFAVKLFGKAVVKELNVSCKNWDRDAALKAAKYGYGRNLMRSYSGQYYVRDQDGNSVVEEYLFADRNDAEQVLKTLNEYADKYGFVSVSDYCDLIKVTSNFKDDVYGWSKDLISTSIIVSIMDKYTITLPPVKEL